MQEARLSDMKNLLVIVALAVAVAGCTQEQTASTYQPTPTDKYVEGVWDAWTARDELGMNLHGNPLEVLDIFAGNLGMIGEGQRFCEIKAQGNHAHSEAFVSYTLDWVVRTGDTSLLVGDWTVVWAVNADEHLC